MIGEIKKNKWHVKFIWVPCVECGKERWVQLIHSKPKDSICNSCCQKNINAKWKSGQYRIKGYEVVALNRSSPFRLMANKEGYIMKHRLIYAQYIKRILTSSEIVHHKNGIITDNRIENLELTNRETHASIHHKRKMAKV